MFFCLSFRMRVKPVHKTFQLTVTAHSKRGPAFWWHITMAPSRRHPQRRVFPLWLKALVQTWWLQGIPLLEIRARFAEIGLHISTSTMATWCNHRYMRRWWHHETHKNDEYWLPNYDGRCWTYVRGLEHFTKNCCENS